ncbi:hypothetical protein Hanom_Chr07g00623581 [Helianthus anomalus]
MFRSICCIKLSTFTHQSAYNPPESDLKLNIEQELICAIDTHIFTITKYEIQYFIGLAFV